MDDFESARSRFFTECQIIAHMHSDASRGLRKNAIEHVRGLYLSLRAGLANNNEVNRLLDHLAFLLVQKRGGDCVALALVGLTKDKIDIVAQPSSDDNRDQTASPASSPASSSTKPLKVKIAANQRSEDFRANISSISQHAQKIFDFVKESSNIYPGDPRRTEIFTELLMLQLDYSSNKLFSRATQLKRFTDKVEGFQLPLSASLEKPKTQDEFSIPPVLDGEGRDPGAPVLIHVYQTFGRTNDSSGLPPVDDMLKLSEHNFDHWTTIFLWFLNKIRTECSRLHSQCSKSRPDRGKQIANTSDYLRIMEQLVSKSQLFREWVEIVTRNLEDQEKQLKKEEEGRSRESLREMARLQQPEEVAVEYTPEPDATETAAFPRKNTPDSPLVPAPEERRRMRDIVRTTAKKAIPKTISKMFNRLTISRRRPKTHVRDIFAGPSQLFPGGNERREHEDASALGGRLDEEQFHPGHQGIDNSTPAYKSTPKRFSQNSFADSFLEEDRGQDGYDDEVETLAVAAQSTAFTMLWLVSQHVRAIKFILHSRQVLGLVRTRDFNFEVLPYNDNQQGVRPCEPLRQTLGRLLSPIGPRDTDEGSRVKRFLAKAEPFRSDKPGSGFLLALDAENPTVTAPIHCELILLSHLQQLKGGTEYPYPYIGISKPPCLTCEAILLYGTGFTAVTQVGHTHAYVSNIPEGIPKPDQRSLFGFINKLAKAVCQDFYVQQRRESKDSHYISQGSPGSSDTDFDRLPAIEERLEE
ncbi:hypothetical protein TWF718_001902 [Orbilia javanica]|uniref:Uncharacterized protein n=1 Tax=Orbilia javanica TaxID=47235 RepID=A0AAN8NEK2_9PEZI